MTEWTPLDKNLAQSLVARGVVSRETLSAIWARGPQGTLRHGSHLAEVLVRQGLLSPGALDGVLNSLAGTSDPADQAQTVTSGSQRQPRASGSGRLVPHAIAQAFAGDRYEPLGPADASGVLPALDRRLQRKVAMHMGPAAQNPGARSFLREARILAQLDHPALPKVHDLGALAGRAFYTLDHLEGRSLAEAYEDALPAQLRAFLEVVAGVDHAHARGLVHGALCPQGVVLGQFGQVWVTGWERATYQPHADEGVLRAVSAAPQPSSLDPALLAPELRKRRAAGPATDVWGLGQILHWILLGALPADRPPTTDAPKALLAVVKKALLTVPGDRYASVAALGEEVRRYLDHRRVEAADETLLQTCRRLARRYPAPAVAAGLVSAAVVGVASLALAQGAADYARLKASVQQAQEQRRAQAKTQALEVVAREAARAAIARAEREQEFERRLLTAVTSAPRGESERKAAPLFARAEELLEEGASPRRIHLHLARGWWFLDHGRADQALTDFTTALNAKPNDEQAALGCTLAAKRLPGSANRKLEAKALADLEGCGGKASTLARATREVQALYAEAETGADVSKRAAAAQALLGELDYDPVDRPRTLAHIEELRGIAYHCELGLYAVMTTLFDPRYRTQAKDARSLLSKGDAALRKAMRMDPATVGPRVLTLRQHGIRWAYQATWRWQSCSALRHLQRVLELSQRPEALLEVAERLQVDRRPAASLLFLERFFATPANAMPDGRALARARVLRARALLYSGRTPELADLKDLPAELELDGALLSAWTRLRQGNSRAGLEGLLKVGRRERRHFYEFWRYRDLEEALCDEHLDARRMAQALAPALRRRTPPNVDPLTLAAMLANLRAGRSSAGELEFADRLMGAEALPARMRRLLLARIPSLGNDPRGHTAALTIWASLNTGSYTDAREVRAARKLLLSRLRAGGRERAAEAFEGVRAIEDLWPPRANVPPLMRVTEAGPR